MEFEKKNHYHVEDLRKIMELLRGENGCPWDREQDHHSIRKNFLEETYEVLEAIDNEDTVLLKEELGDMLLQVVFHARIEEESGSFDLDDVADGICKKLILRHPHVFADVQADTSEKVLENWDAIKKQEKSQKTDTDTLKNVPSILPALMRAEKVQHRAGRAGLDFSDEWEAYMAMNTEIAELQEAMEDGDLTNIEEEIGDLLFSCVNISRFFKIDCEKCLTKATEKFINRFSKVEEFAYSQSIDIKQADSETLNRLWEQAKVETKIK